MSPWEYKTIANNFSVRFIKGVNSDISATFSINIRQFHYSLSRKFVAGFASYTSNFLWWSSPLSFNRRNPLPKIYWPSCILHSIKRAEKRAYQLSFYGRNNDDLLSNFFISSLLLWHKSTSKLFTISFCEN